jgi:hypothetical protein
MNRCTSTNEVCPIKVHAQTYKSYLNSYFFYEAFKHGDGAKCYVTLGQTLHDSVPCAVL